ncbi:hypothetical protein IQ251_12665 [Saccharopolyspora sp. HNM0983]|uniref:Uncharacterized protein n=1 Tax=Saccharopolyspora montiporae TaxID=2781240 RepID=A0A929BD36_9PSEU|nr:hypothetical protein [Saccharopolyspora sp. HNM0983]MBE9375297.1 hypothetical protein [Saccharopolyspora sp. HNM0983]
MTDWILFGSGRRAHDDWADLHALTSDWTAAWADNTGFHWEAMPVGAPNATHLWAWTTGRWLRARLDVPHWWAALLSTDPLDTGPGWTPTSVAPPRVDTVLHWQKGDSRVAAQKATPEESLQLQIECPSAAPFLGAIASLPQALQHLRDLRTSAVTPRR